MSEMTEWFPATIKPARRGWYEVANVPAVHRNSSAFLTGRKRYWDGKQWWGAWFPELAYKWATIFGAHTTHHWRGLAREADVLRAECEAMRALLVPVRGWVEDAGHSPYCDYAGNTTEPCDCGYVAILADIDAAIAAKGE